MIPILLKVKGMYSYQEEVVIDFERLVEGRLFGIFGPVGSGKSALLEAITFALYGRSERLDSRGRSYNMMNLRSNVLLIDFTFALGEEKYRFEVTGRRNSKNFDDVRTFKRTGYVWKEMEWIPLDSNNGGDLLGLSYENFTKTIIIPQGKFQDFLHLNPAARTQMLKELFELERFDLLRPTTDLLNKNKDALNQVLGQLKELPDLDPEVFQQQEKELAEKEVEKARLSGLLDKLRKDKTEMEEVKGLLANMAEIRDTLDLLEESEAYFKQKELLLNRYAKVDRYFREDLRREKELELAKTKAVGDELDFKQQEEKIAAEILVAEEKFKETKFSYERREEWIHKAEEMKRIQDMQELDAEINLIQKRIDKGSKIVEEKDLFCRETEKVELDLTAGIKSVRDGMGDILLLTEVKNWRLEEAGFLQEVANALAQVKEADKEVADASTQLLALEKQPGGDDPGRALDGQVKGMEALQMVLDQLRLQQQLADFATELEAGKPCPLCGAAEHPTPYDAGHAGTHFAEVEEKKRALEAEGLRLRRLGLELEQAQKLLKRSKKQQKGRQLVLAKTEKALAEFSATFRWPAFVEVDAAALDAKMAAVGAAETRLRTLETQLTTAREAQRKAVLDMARFAEKITTLKEEQATFTGRHAALLEQLQIFEYKNYQNKRPVELKAKEDFFRAHYEEVTSAYNREDQLLVQRKDKFQTLKTKIQLAQQDATRFQEDLFQVRDSLSQNLKTHDFPDLNVVKEILEEELNIAEQDQKIKNFKKELERLRTEFATNQKQVAGRIFDEEAHKLLKDELELQEASEKTLHEKIGELKSQMAELGKAMEKRLALEKHKGELQNRGENLSTLRNLFIGSGFVNYVSTMYLHELCQRANERFQKLTRNRLSLLVRDDNTFQVRDMVNDGQIRSVKTLSGGQTFQASLSLALALADNIQHRSESHHNFFFLDEGFGTLDRESLQIVFDTLKQLRREDRIVGVISHVEDLQHEIDHSLMVYQDEKKGSFVKGSWES
ncbi:MAG TPA: SMC family ATPase, partial [Bacteroidetes bacterium]|nr:SMC family ATPase [Bacteroidota bacterium]